MLLKSVLTNYKVILAVTASSYDVSILTYLRFLAKQYFYNSLTVDRESRIKIFGVHSELSYLLSGPVVLFYSNNSSYIELLHRFLNVPGVEIAFIMVNNNIILSDFVSQNVNIVNLRGSLVNTVSPQLLICDFNHILYNLVYLLNANDKSIVQRGSNSSD